MRRVIGVLFGWLLVALPLHAQTLGTIRGVVVDAQGGAPLERVSVRVQDTGATTATDAAGRFEFSDVPAGEHELYVSVVDFLLVTRRVAVRDGAASEVTIALTQGTGTYAETVSVVGVAGTRSSDAPAEARVRGIELQQLSGLLANDPLRAVQALPGVTTGDDFRSEFAVRGAGPAHTGFIFDGISTRFLLHTVRQVNDAGSIAMVNAEVLDSVSLRSGSYPQQQGDRTGAEIEFQVREGARDRPRAHMSVSAVDATAVAEGPLGSAPRGSWLVSARKSYLDLVLKRLYPDQTVNFGFGDVQSKLAWDLSARHRVELSATAGRSRLDLVPDAVSNPNDLRDAMNESAIGVLSWRVTPGLRFSLTQRVSVAANSFRNTSRDGPVLDDGTTRDVVYRADWTMPLSARVAFDGGSEARWIDEAGNEQRVSGTRLLVRERFIAPSRRHGAYVQSRIRMKGATLTPGVRVDHWSITETTAVSPWVQATAPLTPSVSVRAGSGVYRQAPDASEVLGVRGTANLANWRAYHADAGLEGPLRGQLRWQVIAYDREDRDLLRLPGVEARMNGIVFVPGSVTTKWRNALDGHARGVEWLLERRSDRGVSGWVSYALGYTRYTDSVTGEHFWGDDDQRHTFNAFGTYRMSDRTSLSARVRLGSNTPAAGYWTQRDGAYWVSDSRNTLRTPGYARVDLRANRTVTRMHGRMTLYVEVLNVLGRDNQRFLPPGASRRTVEASKMFESMLPLVPSAGLLVEF